jgi:hypothetical protein
MRQRRTPETGGSVSLYTSNDRVVVVEIFCRFPSAPPLDDLLIWTFTGACTSLRLSPLRFPDQWNIGGVALARDAGNGRIELPISQV